MKRTIPNIFNDQILNKIGKELYFGNSENKTRKE